MSNRWLIAAGLLALSASAAGASAQTQPLSLLIDPEPESVYAPPAPSRPEEGINEGGAHLDLRVNYMTDYVFRGIEIVEPPGPEDRPNLQFDGTLSWDLGRAPHPFIGAFVNVADSDPVSRFQEIRPFFGAQWTIKPFIVTAGNNTYIYNNRDPLNTSEVFGKVLFDDSFIWRSERPMVSPYIFGAYDFNKYHGWYFEAGLSHDFIIPDTGITITAYGHVGYVQGMEEFQRTAGGQDTGYQHYQFGLVGRYSLNTLFNVSKRYGEWSLIGYLNYTDGLDNDLRANTQKWGGAGISFVY
jgi:hypothetical protein